MGYDKMILVFGPTVAASVTKFILEYFSKKNQNTTYLDDLKKIKELIKPTYSTNECGYGGEVLDRLITLTNPYKGRFKKANIILNSIKKDWGEVSKLESNLHEVYTEANKYLKNNRYSSNDTKYFEVLFERGLDVRSYVSKVLSIKDSICKLHELKAKKSKELESIIEKIRY